MGLSLTGRLLAASAIAAVGAALVTAADPAPAADAGPLAPLTAVAGRIVPGHYIVVLKPGVTVPDVDLFAAPASGDRVVGAAATGAQVARQAAVVVPAVLDAVRRAGRLDRQFASVINGFSAALDPALLAAVRADPQVAFVEPDQYVSAQAAQKNPGWGLDRIDQRSLPVNRSYTYSRTGTGVNAYIIDTGIRADHKDFGGRVSGGFTTVADGRGTGDCSGHGTHVAGTVGSGTYGVAKRVHLVPVRVLGCDGTGMNSAVIAGIDWVTKHRVRPAVANLSLGGSFSPALDNAVSASIAAGVTYAVAAGNSSSWACADSPARVQEALTVGATQSNDQTAGYSNWGSCIDLFAPGTDITSTWNSSATATTTISGTSMASPHVAGAAALYLQGHPSASPATVSSALVGAATPGVLSWAILGSPNKLLYAPVR
jgi:aqualysin 1